MEKTKLTKTCNCCKQEKEIDCFNKDLSRKDGYTYKCKECTKLYTDSRKLERKLYNSKPEVIIKRKIYNEENEEKHPVPGNSSVSMNFWCFHPSVFQQAGNLFKEFVPNNRDNIKAEFFIPIIADEFIKSEGNTIKVIPTSSQWFGVTYKEDAVAVKSSIDKLIADKVYPVSLW